MSNSDFASGNRKTDTHTPLDFDRMRESLVERGLLDADYRVTRAGEMFTDQLISTLNETRAQAVLLK